MNSRFKGLSDIVSVTLVTGFIVVSVVIALTWALPLVQQSQSLAEMQRMKSTMSNIDDYIRTVSHSGNATTRSVTVSVREGQIMLTNSSITYVIDVGQPLIKNGVTIREKNVWLTGVGNSVFMKLNYSSVELSALGVVSGNKEIVITKIGDRNNRPLVEVKSA